MIKNLAEVVLPHQIIDLQMNFTSRSLEKVKKQKVISSFRDNILGVDLPDIQSLSMYNKAINTTKESKEYLICAFDVFTKYAWVVSLKDKRGINIINLFQKIISKGRKPNKTWVDQGTEFYNNLFKRFLKISNIEMYSTTCNEGKSAAVERFIRMLKNKILKHMEAVSKNVYFDVLDNTVNKYNNTVHRIIKMKPIDITSDS